MTSRRHSLCLLCLAKHQGQEIICEQCIKELNLIDFNQACLICKAPMPEAKICGACLNHSWHFQRLDVPFYYNAMAKYLLHQLKFYQHLLILPLFSKLMALHLQSYFHECQPEVIVPVPIHPWRIWRRGFNQAHELAKRLGKAYQIEVNPHLVRKVKLTKAQARLSLKERQNNIRSSFKVRLNRPLSHVLIIDDVFTSGTTVNTLAQEFKKAGVARVDVATLFRAL